MKQKYYSKINWNIVELYLPDMENIILDIELNNKIKEGENKLEKKIFAVKSTGIVICYECIQPIINKN
mgnify:CR=1 FL=1